MIQKYRALKVKDKYVEFKWNEVMDWEDTLLSDINESTFDNIMFSNFNYLDVRFKKLINDLIDFGEMDDIKISDIDDIKLVELELCVKINKEEVLND